MSTYYVGTIACDSNYLAHYGVPGMEWGVKKKKRDYALDQANIDRRKAMAREQDARYQEAVDYAAETGDTGDYRRLSRKYGETSINTGSHAQAIEKNSGTKKLVAEQMRRSNNYRGVSTPAAEERYRQKQNDWERRAAAAEPGVEARASINDRNRVTQESKRRDQIEQQIRKKKGRTKPLEFAAQFSRH